MLVYVYIFNFSLFIFGIYFEAFVVEKIVFYKRSNERFFLWAITNYLFCLPVDPALDVSDSTGFGRSNLSLFFGSGLAVGNGSPTRHAAPLCTRQ